MSTSIAIAITRLAALALCAVAAGAHAQPAPPASPVPVINYEYDAQGNATKVVQAPGAAGFNFATQSTYDTLNRRKNTTDAKAGVTQFGYDGLDRTVQVTDPRSLITQSPRNGLGDTTALISPDTGSAAQTYDAAGNLKTRTDSRGALASYSYDALNRPTSVAYSQAGQNSRTYSWAYDQTGAGFSNGIGRLTSTSFPLGTTTLAYDPQGRLTRSVQTLAGSPLTTSYQYDAGGRLANLVYPSGYVLALGYAANGLPNSLGLAQNLGAAVFPMLAQIQYQPFGGVSAWQWNTGSGLVANNRSFDTSGRLVRYRIGSILRDLGYDSADRITNYTHRDATTFAALPTLDQGFTYDELGRLTGLTVNAASYAIAYDANGNRISQTVNGSVVGYTTASNSNRLTATTNPARSFGYDNAGNTTSDSARAYTATYNPEGRLETVTKAGVTTTYFYDAGGQRVAKSTAGSTSVVFVYDTAGHLLGEYASTGSFAEYFWLDDTPVAVLRFDVATASGGLYYIHTDHLNAPVAVVDLNSQLRWQWLREPFGATAPNTNPAGLGAFSFNLRFPGQFADSETGLSYNYFRDYDASTGRYVQSDPIGLAGGINTYAYVEGNPVSYTDARGLNPGAAAGAGIGSFFGPVGTVVGGVIGFGAGAWLGWNVVGPMVTEARGWFNNADANREWQAYKDSYSAPMPPGMDPCDEARWRLKREQDLLNARRAWDAKWVPLGAQSHSSAIQQSEQAVKNAQKRVERDCKCP